MKKQFTLIELLVVIAIIAILAAILMPALSSARERGKQATCINNMKSFGTAIAHYADDFTTYPWPADKKWSLPKSTATGSHTIWSLLTGFDGAVKYSNSYVAPYGKKNKNGTKPALVCSSHDGQNNTSTTLVAHYMFVATSASYYGMTGGTKYAKENNRWGTAPQHVKQPGTKLAMVERSLKNFVLGDYAYTINSTQYLYDGNESTTYKVGPVHNGKGTGLHYDGHVTMLDMVGEFFKSDSSRGTQIYKRYFDCKIIY
ncbi:MAG: DUF1559 domain-containing protein [Lentisphaeria bacterium]|nr:DUF1559 domain-containing protein [Lentisphaeria bacterium]